MEVSGAECLPHTYQESIDYLGQLEYGATGGYRQWIYQTCTEFGWYQSSDQPGHPYGTKFPVDFTVKVKPKSPRLMQIPLVRNSTSALEKIKKYLFI